jgi:hypothetical protein
LFLVGGEHHDEPAEQTADALTLFRDEDDFLYAALTDLFAGDHHLELHRDADRDLVAMRTPDDLKLMLRDLPASYRRDREIDTRIRLTGDAGLALARLADAKDSGETMWPDVHYLAPIHPVLSWVSSRLLARLDRNQAPVMAAAVAGPVFLTQAMWSNHRGQAALLHWGAISGLESGAPRVSELVPALKQAGIAERAINPGRVEGLEQLQALVLAAVAAARADLRDRHDELVGPLRERVAQEESRVHEWQEAALLEAEQGAASVARRRRERANDASARALEYLRSLLPAGEPYVRVVGVLAPIESASATGRG